GLVCLCALLAFLWRELDTPKVHTVLTWFSSGWLLDWNRPFLPALLFLSAWLFSWCVYYLVWLRRVKGWVLCLVYTSSLAIVAVACCLGIGYAWFEQHPAAYAVAFGIGVGVVVILNAS